MRSGMSTCLPLNKILSSIPSSSRYDQNERKGGSVLVHVGTNNVEKEGTTAIVKLDG